MQSGRWQVAVGRIRLKPEASRWRFLWHTLLAYRQARRAPGNLYAAVRGEDPLTYWSLSVWRSREAMRRYRDSGSHRRAMRSAQRLAARIDFCHWEADAIPDWEEAQRDFRRRRGEVPAPPPITFGS